MMNINKQAQEILLKLIEKIETDRMQGEWINNLVSDAWILADAMQAEADKRKPKGLPDAIKGLESSKKIPPLDKDATIKYSDGLVIDWSQAPESVKFWAMDENGSAAWYEVMPYIDVDEFNYEFGLGGATHVKAPSFNYQGDWKSSLRKRT